MRSSSMALAAAVAVEASAAAVTYPSLASVCNTAYILAKLPNVTVGYGIDGDTVYTGLNISTASIKATPITNTTFASSDNYPGAGPFDFCNVTLAYSHNGRNDNVNLNFWLPAPVRFQNRYLSTGGGGLAINSGTGLTGSLPGGIIYGAVSGLTDGGFGSFTTQADANFILANGSVNYEDLYMFGYKAHEELTAVGKQLTKNFYNMSAPTAATSFSPATNSTRLYSYYQACSEGGREGWSQVQRYAEWDGAVIGAPAFRYGHQQVNHLLSTTVEQTLDYYPSPCELMAIVNATIAACDPLDGLTDGVVSRTDLCALHFNLSSTIGIPYSCPAAAGGMMGMVATPATNGTVSAQAVAVANTINAGLKDSQGRQAYFSYQLSSTYSDAQTAYNATTGKYGLSIDGLGGEWVVRFLQLQSSSSFTSAVFANYTYQTLVDLMYEGWQKYEDVLQTTWPDLTPYYENGGKVLHYHGESDYSVPTASSVRYWDSVRTIMYPGMSYNSSAAALGNWYRLFLVPGAGHCGPNSFEPNGPWPQTNLQVMINWVEKDIVPTTLNATHLAGAQLGQNAQICSWPLRPLWTSGVMSCVYDQASLNTWSYNLTAFKMPVY